MFVARVPKLIRIGVGLSCLLAAGCEGLWDKATGRQLSRGHEKDDELGPSAPPPDGPRLGILADFTPVYDAPDRNSRRLGWLHAGAQVARAERATQASGCSEGWYSIYPRGYVCIGNGATLDLKHPTLAAMGLAPRLNEPLPYPYAEARVATEVFLPNNEPDPSVRSVARLGPAATFAIVGSWQAMDETDQRLRLALMTRGAFVRVDDLKAVEAPGATGVHLESTSLPLAFVTRDGVKTWRLEEERAVPGRSLSKGSTLHLGARPRLLGPVRYYMLDQGDWVQDSDVTVVRLRNDWPSFASAGKRWVDVNRVDHTVVLYEGQHPTFAALLMSAGSETSPKYVGQTEVAAKYVTDMQLDPRNAASTTHDVYDMPWVIELRNGVRLNASLGRPKRAGALQTARLELAPPDAQFVWNWVAPALPTGWHGVDASEREERRTPVLIR